ncbi:hypothetical protein GQ55_1G183700 [Panicum hallii var. hallii]|uniref:Uncharacterized protein n=1 Tax=Panicum hallii var. hallii TaxID=1504633 RepID=A0A2T7F643_9POAL|nr:hypothetical protein GQ55_1G183700 [Panicum hallii var. hallii]
MRLRSNPTPPLQIERLRTSGRALAAAGAWTRRRAAALRRRTRVRALPASIRGMAGTGREREARGSDFGGSGAAMRAVAAERRRRAARERRRARAAAGERDRGEREAGEDPYHTGTSSRGLNDGGSRRGGGTAAARGARRRRARELGFRAAGHRGG